MFEGLLRRSGEEEPIRSHTSELLASREWQISQSTSSWGAPDRPLVWRCCSATLSGRPGPQPRVPPDQAPHPLPLHPHFPRTADLEPDLIHQIRTKYDQCPVEETRAIARRAYLTYERDEPDRWVQLWR